MANTYTAVTKQDGGWWIGWIEEVSGVNCQKRTRQELLASLRTTLVEAVELNREDAIRTACSRLHRGTGYRMKRTELLRHLREHDCGFVREGGNHSWWGNLALNRRSSVPPPHRDQR